MSVNMFRCNFVITFENRRSCWDCPLCYDTISCLHPAGPKYINNDCAAGIITPVNADDLIDWTLCPLIKETSNEN